MRLVTGFKLLNLNNLKGYNLKVVIRVLDFLPRWNEKHQHGD